jgi:superfamily II DNA/RNA helicase
MDKILKSAENESSEMDQEEAGFVKAVILVPTRELCEQVTNMIRILLD